MPVRPRPLLPLWAAVLAAAAGGLLLTAAFPASGRWPVVFAAVLPRGPGAVADPPPVVVRSR